MLIAKVAGVMVCFLIIAYALSFYYNRQVSVETYFLPGKEEQAYIKFAFLTDIHDSLYEKRLNELVGHLKKEKPDFILVGGDVVVKKRFHPEKALSFLKEIADIAPVYYANGNHEMKLSLTMPEEMEQYNKQVQALGVHRLVNESIGICMKGKTINLCGLDLPESFFRKLGKPEKLTKEKIDAFVGMKRKEYTILLAHHPRYFDAYADWGADLVLSGHIHGGVIRLPKVGGLLSPDLSFFPKYSGGMYHKKNSVMIVSRGIGVHSIPFRLFNKPELSMVVQTENEGLSPHFQDGAH